jgi:outer membrane lipoprotein-sorting protein
VLQRIQDARRGVNNVVAEFDQDRVMGLFAQTLHAQGRLMVLAPNNLRWEITAPNPGVFISSAGHVAYSAAGSSGTATNQQVGPLSAVLGHIAVFMGGQLQALTAEYNMTATTQPNGTVAIVAVPRAAAISALVSQVRLVFSANLRVIESIDIQEPGGDRTSIRLRAPQVNSPLVTAASFQLPAPRRP